MSSLPESVLAMVEYDPIEDVVLAALRNRLPDVHVGSWIAENQGTPFLLARRSPEPGNWSGESRFVDAAHVDLHAFVSGINADQDGALLLEAARVALRDAWVNHDRLNGHGWLTYVQQTISPHRVPDWATATGPVQYADLPVDWIRYQSTLYIEVRTDLS